MSAYIQKIRPIKNDFQEIKNHLDELIDYVRKSKLPNQFIILDTQLCKQAAYCERVISNLNIVEGFLTSNLLRFANHYLDADNDFTRDLIDSAIKVKEKEEKENLIRWIMPFFIYSQKRYQSDNAAKMFFLLRSWSHLNENDAKEMSSWLKSFSPSPSITTFFGETSYYPKYIENLIIEAISKQEFNRDAVLNKTLELSENNAIELDHTYSPGMRKPH